MRERISYIFKILMVFLAIFVVGKIFFMIYNGGESPWRSVDVMEVVRHGFSLDFSTSLYFVALPLIVILVSLWLTSWRVLRGVLKGYYIIIGIAIGLAIVADASLYEFWHFKLDSSFFQFLDSTGDAFASVSGTYLLLRFVGGGIWSYAIYKCLVWVTPKELKPLTLGKRIGGSIAGLAMIPLMVIGIRGGLDVSTTNIGQVYYSENQFLNHSAVNPVFSFLSSLGKVSQANETEKLYHFYDEHELALLQMNLFPVSSGQSSDTLLTSQRPNVLLVLMEGCGGRFTYLVGDTVTTPNLTSLSREGVSFERCYANSFRTDRGLVCALSGYESFPTVSVMKVPSKSRSLPSLAHSLKREGYSTAFVYGGDANFTNMRSYLISTGYEKVVSQEDFTAEERGSSKWGVTDSIVFDRTYDMWMEATASGRPAFLTLLTLSSHEPWDVPIHHIQDNEMNNAFYYLDWCIGKFVAKLKQSPAWDNTLLIFMPDHDIALKSSDPNSSQIPQIWCGGAVALRKTIGQLSNQSDLPATLLGQMGIPHDDFAYSRDVLDSAYQQHQAVHYFNNGFCVWDEEGFTMYDFNADKVMVDEPSPSEERVANGKAVLQLVAEDFASR